MSYPIKKNLHDITINEIYHSTIKHHQTYSHSNTNPNHLQRQRPYLRAWPSWRFAWLAGASSTSSAASALGSGAIGGLRLVAPGWFGWEELGKIHGTHMENNMGIVWNNMENIWKIYGIIIVKTLGIIWKRMTYYDWLWLYSGDTLADTLTETYLSGPANFQTW